MKTEEELTDLARAAFRGAIFTSLQVRPGDEKLIPSIFLVLALMDGTAREEFLKHKPAMLYADMADASPRSVNGYPSFFSLNFLNIEETNVFMDKYNAIVDAVKSV